MQVRLEPRPSGGYVAYVESHEGEHAIVETCEGSAAQACVAAADALREAASGFDALAAAQIASGG